MPRAPAALGAQRIVERDVAAAAVKEAVHRAATVKVRPDDLARIVDAAGSGALGAQRIVERDVGTATIKEAVLHVAAVRVHPRRSGPRC